MAAAACAVQVVLQAIVFVDARFVIARMAAGTGGCITGRRPIHRIRVGIVAVGAVEVAAVIERFIRKAAVTETRRGPAVRRVTLTTIDGRGEVSRIHSASVSAVMAGRTGPQDLVVVDRSNGRPDNRTVAVLTDVRGQDMRRTLARCVTAVVATGAVVNDVGMVEGRRCPCNRRVTVIAVIAAANVRRMLAGRGRAIMTGAAAAEDLGVVDGIGRNPHVRRMAVFADIA